MRFKTASIANLLGLAIAFTAFLIVAMYVNHEYSYDTHHPNGERIFKVEFLRDNNTWEDGYARVLLEELIHSSPHIEAGGIFQDLAYTPAVAISVGENPGESVFYEHFERVTPGFTDVIRFEMVEGDAKAIAEPSQILIPESIARKFFGKEEALGRKIFALDLASLGEDENSKHRGVLYVGGVYKDFPENSRVKNVLYSGIPPQEMMGEWFAGGYRLYIRLNDPAVADEVAATITAQRREHLKRLNIFDVRFRPIAGLYFGEKAKNDIASTGNKTLTDILFFVAVLIIVIAAINYVNFSMALTPVRVKNINTQKVLGCPVGVIRRNLVLEAVGITVVAFLLAILIMWIIKDLGILDRLFVTTLSPGDNLTIVGITFVLALAVGVITGLYPAWHITSFSPAIALSGSFALTGRARVVRKTLIGFQYVVSIVLIVVALFVQIQLKYINAIDSGFNKENILQIKLSPSIADGKSEVFREMVRQHPDVIDAAFAEHEFIRDEGKGNIAYYYRKERLLQYYIGVSPNFPAVMGIPIVGGRDFRPGDEIQQSPKQAVCIINEAASKQMAAVTAGRDTLPKADYHTVADFSFWEGGPNNIGVNVRVAGIFKDIHFESLYRPILPLGLWVAAPGNYRHEKPFRYAYVRITGHNPVTAIDHIQSTLRELDSVFPPEVEFLDKAMEKLYVKSQNQGVLITIFSMLAVLISIIGVFGLVIFEAQGRTKEIALRKVLGATVKEILVMLNTGFVKIVFVCFIIAVPLAWIGTGKWLESFAYKTPIHLWVFFIALALVLLLTVLTVTLQSYRVATSNPAKSLKAG